MGLGNTPYQYMETEEYADLKIKSCHPLPLPVTC